MGGLAAVVALAIGTFGYLARNHTEPAVLFARAIECLTERDNPEAMSEARKIASELDALHYRDPKFIGALPFILGITDFRKAQKQNDRERVESFRAAVRHLDQAASIGLDDGHRLECEFALGISRSAIGDSLGAEEPLKRIVNISQAVPNPPPEFFAAAAALQESYLDLRGPSQLRQASR